MSETLSDEELNEIIAGCEGVTPGPWIAREMVRYDEVRGYFVQAPDMNGFAYGAELLAEDEYRDIDGRDPGIVRWKADATHIARLSPERVRSAFSELLAARKKLAELEAEGFIVGDGGQTQWRRWQDGECVWTDDPSLATRYARREDADAVHYGDDDVWCIKALREALPSIPKGD